MKLSKLRVLWDNTLGPMYKKIKADYVIWDCKHHNIIENLRTDISKKDRIKVVFFAIKVGMWKYDELFQLLLKSDRFEPCVVSFLHPLDDYEYRVNNQNELRNYFTSKGYPYYDCYNFETGELLDILSLSPDIVFYAQNYNSGYNKYRIEYLYKHVLFSYVPYSLVLVGVKSFYNLLLSNVAWKMFYPTESQKQLEVKYTANKGVNVDVVGGLILDEFNRGAKSDPWKIKNSKFKRIIWAPHHTIVKTDVLQYSTFLEIASDMLECAKKYKESVQFVFKPHPMLKQKLYENESWGVEKTDAYYKEWQSMDNTTFVDGNYIDLFLTSDALIHDCGSFSGEYLYMDKPCMFLVKGDHDKFLSGFGKECFDMHYKGYSIIDVEKFIEDVVLSGEDYMKESRITFKQNNLMPPYGDSPSKNIYDIMVKEFNK